MSDKKGGSGSKMKMNWGIIESGKFGRSVWYDIGEFRVKLTECKYDWVVSFAVRAYTKDGSDSIFRPYQNIVRFEKPCSMEQAREYMGAYLERLANGILKCME